MPRPRRARAACDGGGRFPRSRRRRFETCERPLRVGRASWKMGRHGWPQTPCFDTPERARAGGDRGSGPDRGSRARAGGHAPAPRRAGFRGRAVGQRRPRTHRGAATRSARRRARLPGSMRRLRPGVRAAATASTWRSAPLRLPCSSGAWPTRGVRGVRGLCVTPVAARRAERVLDKRGGHHLHRCHLKKGWHRKNDGRAQPGGRSGAATGRAGRRPGSRCCAGVNAWIGARRARRGARSPG